jgi:hypothetical protein
MFVLKKMKVQKIWIYSIPVILTVSTTYLLNLILTN